jgi:hypothetical protein
MAYKAYMSGDGGGGLLAGASIAALLVAFILFLSMNLI